MKFLQMTKRLALFLIVNLLVMLTITLLLSLLTIRKSARRLVICKKFMVSVSN